MRLEQEIKLGFKDVLIKPKRSTLKSRSEVSLERTFRMKWTQAEWTGVPLFASNMDTVGTFEMAAALEKEKILTAIHKHYTFDDWQKFLEKKDPSIYNYLAVSTGIMDEDLSRLSALLEAFPALSFVCMDVANGYTQRFVDCVKSVRERFPKINIIAGNVVTPEMTEELILSGADIIKVGIGSGSVCTTRVKTGVGYPQLSAIIECADAAHGLKGLVISDGGCTCSGDVAKAFAAGSDFVMLGGMLAGHEEAGGEKLQEGDQCYMQFYGMSSKVAMDKHAGGVANYKASEGKMVKIPYRGSVHETLKDILGGIRSTCTYVGGRSLKELSKRTTFIRTLEQENQIFSH